MNKQTFLRVFGQISNNEDKESSNEQKTDQSELFNARKDSNISPNINNKINQSK